MSSLEMYSIDPEISQGGRKVALVTGGTSGVGLALLPELLESGFAVYFVGRNADKGKSIEAEFNTDGRRCAFIQLDLSTLASVRDFARAFVSQVPRLNVLLNVAGVSLPSRKMTSEGFEMTFAVDFLAAVVLTNELLPALTAASPSRVVNVAGDPSVILRRRLDFEDLQKAKGYGMLAASFDAVHAKTVMTAIHAEQFRDRGVDVNSFHPGLIKGELARHQRFPRNLLTKFLYLFASDTCTSGSYAATGNELQGVTGKLFVKRTYRDIRFDSSYKETLERTTRQLLSPILDN